MQHGYKYDFVAGPCLKLKSGNEGLYTTETLFCTFNTIYDFLTFIWPNCVAIVTKSLPASAEGIVAVRSPPTLPKDALANAGILRSSDDWSSLWTGGPTQHLWWLPDPSGSSHRQEGCQPHDRCPPYSWEQVTDIYWLASFQLESKKSTCTLFSDHEVLPRPLAWAWRRRPRC